MLRYKLRTLMIVLAVLPPMLAWYGWPVVQRMMQAPPTKLEFRLIPGNPPGVWDHDVDWDGIPSAVWIDPDKK